MDSTGPVRDQGDLAEMVELLLEKGVVVNADVVVSVGDTELLGVELRAAIASFETAAKYGLEFPDGTDRERVLEAADVADDDVADEVGEAITGRSSEADRRTPAGAEDVSIDPAPYEPTRTDLEPDVEDPGVDHPEVDGPGPARTDGDETGQTDADVQASEGRTDEDPDGDTDDGDTDDRSDDGGDER